MSRRKRTLPKKFRPGFLDSMDQRYSTAIQAKRALVDLLNQLDGQSTPRAQAMLAERATWLHIRLQTLESEFARSGTLDWRGYTQLTLTLTTVLKSLGLFEAANAEPPFIQSLREAVSRAHGLGPQVIRGDSGDAVEPAPDNSSPGNS